MAEGFSQGTSTAIAYPGMSGRSYGRAQSVVAIAAGPFSQLRKAGATVVSAYYGPLEVVKAYYGDILVARFKRFRKSVAAAAGSATVTAVGGSLATSGAGSSVGSSTVQGVSTSQGLMVGTSAGISSVVATSDAATQIGAGTAAGVATVTAVGTTGQKAFVFPGAGGACFYATQSTSSPNRRTLTISLWAKVANFAAYQVLVGADTDDNNFADFLFYLASGDGMGCFEFIAGVDAIDEGAGGSLTDGDNAWHHWVERVDTTSATADDRWRIYKDGTLWADTGVMPSPQNVQTSIFLSGRPLIFGSSETAASSSDFLGGKLAFMDFVEGASLAPTDFAFNNGGVWTRKKFTGSYGTNGFGLDGSSGLNTTFGKAYTFSQTGTITISSSDLPPYTA